MKRITRSVGGALMAVGLISSADALAHARWKLAAGGGTTPPRNTSTGLKASPCGGVARTSTPTVLTAGQRLVLHWEETINHPGYYRIAFSQDGDVFPPALPAPTAQTPASSTLWVPFVLDIPGQSNYQASVTVPDVACTNCTLQMIQYMTESNPPTMYYSCADIEIRRPAASPVPSSSPKPVPSPSSSPGC